MPIVVGRLAAHTPSFFSVFSSILDATTKGGAHWNQDNGIFKTNNLRISELIF
jgi:hypothetical protein